MSVTTADVEGNGIQQDVLNLLTVPIQISDRAGTAVPRLEISRYLQILMLEKACPPQGNSSPAVICTVSSVM